MFYTNVIRKGQKILFRGIDDNGKPIKKIIDDFRPSFFVPCDEAESNTKYKTIKNQSLRQYTFDNYYQFKDKINLFTGAKEIFGNLNPVSQFISELFPNKIEFDYTKLYILSVDIETTVDHGPPNPIAANEEITLITCQDINNKKTTTFSLFDSNEDLSNQTHFIKCEDESDLLMRFINFIAVKHPDIITGWNSNAFDITYISHRILKKFGESALKRLSPWGSYSFKEVLTGYSNKDIIFSWDGIALIDYKDIYKKFKYVDKPENYKLDTVGKHELNEEKLVNPYKSFKEFYEKDPTLFIKYNIRDANIVSNLEKKLQFLRIMAVMAYEGKCNYRDVMFTTVLWDSIIYNYLLDRGYVVHNRLEEEYGTSSYKIIGGYVKAPIPGLYRWLTSFDATSLYPSIMMGLNISPDTIIDDTSFPELRGLKAEDKIEKFLNGEIEINDDTYSIAANGAKFDKTKRGFIPDIIELYFNLRNSHKKKMIEYEKEYQQTKDNYLKEFKIPEYDAFQMAFKILQNSLFGALGEANFRWFDNRLAEAITSTGQLLNRNVEKTLNNFFNSKFDIDKDWISYMDTDSCTGETLITVNNKQLSIAEFYDSLDIEADCKGVKHIKGKQYITPSVNDKLEIEYNQIRYAMKHTVTKRMYEVIIDEKSVVITEDHSIMILRNGVLMEAKPNEIIEGDKLLYVC